MDEWGLNFDPSGNRVVVNRWLEELFSGLG